MSSCASSGSASPGQAQQAALSYQIQIAVQSKQLSAARQQGDAINTLLESALNVAKQPELGDQVDVQA